MKPIHTNLMCAIAAQLFSITICNAQALNMKAAPAGVAIDGNANEWGNELINTNDKAKVSYTISNDKDNLYLVVKTNDAEKQGNILGSGITFGIDPRGKKKLAFNVTFPVADKDNAAEYTKMTSASIKSKIGVTRLKKMNVEGFKEIADEEITNPNDYNIIADIGYSTDGYLVYEEAIPLKLFGNAGNPGKEWTFNIKVNGLDSRMRVYRAMVQVKREVRATSGPGSIPSVGARGNNVITGDKMGSQVYNADTPSNEYRITQLTPSVDIDGKFLLAN